MKKIVLTLALSITCAIFAQAQTEKGTLLLGGGAGFNSVKTGDADATNTISITPNVGFFLKENLALGGRVLLNNSKTGDADAENTIAVGPFVRYYFLPIGSNAKLMADAGFGLGSTNLPGESKSLTYWSLAAGPAFFLNERTALEVTFSYNSVNIADFDDATNTLGVNVGLQIHFGK